MTKRCEFMGLRGSCTPIQDEDRIGQNRCVCPTGSADELTSDELTSENRETAVGKYESSTRAENPMARGNIANGC